MKALLILFAAAATIGPPLPRPEPERIDIGDKPSVQLVTSSGTTITIENDDRSGSQVIYLAPADKRPARILTIHGKNHPGVELRTERDNIVTVLWDFDGDGLPNFRRVYERRGSSLHQIKAEELHWAATPSDK